MFGTNNLRRVSASPHSSFEFVYNQINLVGVATPSRGNFAKGRRHTNTSTTASRPVNVPQFTVGPFGNRGPTKITEGKRTVIASGLDEKPDAAGFLSERTSWASAVASRKRHISTFDLHIGLGDFLRVEMK